MQVDTLRKELYEKEAPELLDAITTGEADLIMKRDPETDYCVKFEQGICPVHRDYGTNFLGDACHFFPRITRKFGDELLMAGTLSCPEITRLILSENDPFALVDTEIDRTPVEIKDYLPKGLESNSALNVTNALITMAGDKNISPERIMARLITISTSLKNTDSKRWPDGINMLINMADNILPVPETDSNDPYFLMQTLAALIHASRKTSRPRLEATFATMEKALGMTIDKETLNIMINIGQEDYPTKLQKCWQQGAEQAMAPILRRWIQAQLAMSSYPYAGFGNTIEEKITILCVRFATIKLALMSHMDNTGNAPNIDTAITAIQSLARFMDHLADPELSMNMYNDAGWSSDARLRGLVGDH